MENNHFSRHFDIDGMLHEDMLWLTIQAKLPLDEFLEIGRQLDLRQEDWAEFWKIIRDNQLKEETFECSIKGKDWKLTKEEFELVEQLLGGHIDEVSNCCGEKVFQGDICSDCREHCGIVYIFI